MSALENNEPPQTSAVERSTRTSAFVNERSTS